MILLWNGVRWTLALHGAFPVTSLLIRFSILGSGKLVRYLGPEWNKHQWLIAMRLSTDIHVSSGLILLTLVIPWLFFLPNHEIDVLEWNVPTAIGWIAIKLCVFFSLLFFANLKSNQIKGTRANSLQAWKYHHLECLWRFSVQEIK